MGVDFYACKNCGDTFPDCGDYIGCECGENWCDDKCAEADGYRYREYEDEDEDVIEEASCNFCRKEDYNDWELLSYALGRLGMSRKELIEDYKKNGSAK